MPCDTYMKELVRTGDAEHKVGEGGAGEDVVSIPAPQIVGAKAARNRIIALVPVDEVIPGDCVDGIITAPREDQIAQIVRPCSAEDQVVTVTAVQSVCAPKP